MIQKIFIVLVLIISAVQTQFDDLRLFPGEECFRDCSLAPRVCHFHWHLENYHVLGPACRSCGKVNVNIDDCYNKQCITADGIERGVMSVNRKIPGPPIHVCENDLIVVDVTNLMGGTSATIHWHGFHHRKTPFFDGVPFITQCPIDFSTTFRYAFLATEAGTQFYHSHSGHHKVNGHYGGIVVRRPPANDPNFDTYDFDLRDHLMVISDWMEQDSEMFVPGLRSFPTRATNLLINGKGTVYDKTTRKSIKNVPLEVFYVERGHRYRFRLVNSMSHVCPALLEIENHSMRIISSDSFDLQPVEIDSLISLPGERYDFVIDANQTGDSFWIRLRAIGNCESRQLEQFAILSYANTTDGNRNSAAFPLASVPEFEKKFSGGGRSLNHPSTKCGTGSSDKLCITDLSSYLNKPDITDAEPDAQIFLGFEVKTDRFEDVFESQKYEHFNTRSENAVVGTINNISFTLPSYCPLTQPDKIDENDFCDKDNRPERCRGKTICRCVHRIKVKLNDIVELVVVDETPAINTVNHPFHLHGYRLHVVGMGQDPVKPMTIPIAKQMIAANKKLKIPRKKYPVKDTISIPSKGFTIFRIKANNPGWWLMHCHYEWHMGNGMALVLQVGEPSDMVKAPRNFPQCDNYAPNIHTLFNNKTISNML